MSPEYNPTSREITVSGPEHPRLVLGAFGYADSILSRENPTYNFPVGDAMVVIAHLNKVEITETDPARRTVVCSLGDALLTIFCSSIKNDERTGHTADE